MPEVGEIAPSFELPSTSDGQIMRLEDLRGKRIVLYFYPRDNTPGCTQEACDFRDNMNRLQDQGAIVLGVSTDSMVSHERFRAKYDLPFDLLSDPDASVATQYGAYGEKNMYGRKVTGTIRSTFVIGSDGRIEAKWSPVRVKGHVDQVLATLSGEQAPNPRAQGKKSAKKK